MPQSSFKSFSWDSQRYQPWKGRYFIYDEGEPIFAFRWLEICPRFSSYFYDSSQVLFLYFVIIHLWVSSQCITKDRFPLGSHILQKNSTVYFSNTCVEHLTVGGSTVFTCWSEAQSIDWLRYEESRAFEELSCTGVGWIRVVLLFDSWLRVWSYLYSHQFRNNWFPTFQPTGISLYWFLWLFLYTHF